MASVDQSQFLTRVRQALGHDNRVKRLWPERLQEPNPNRRHALVKRIAERSRQQRLSLLDTLKERCRQSNIGIQVGDQPKEAALFIADLVQSRCGKGEDARHVIRWRHPLLDKLNLTGRLPDDGVTHSLHTHEPNRSAQEPAAEDTQRAQFHSQVAAAGIGVTSADYCLADSATLVMRTRPGQPRAVSLVPPVHIAVITLEEILLDLQELYAMLSDSIRREGEGVTNCMTFISGPSTTRDIEAIPVAGAQGPREIHIVVISGDIS